MFSRSLCLSLALLALTPSVARADEAYRMSPRKEAGGSLIGGTTGSGASASFSMEQRPSDYPSGWDMPYMRVDVELGATSGGQGEGLRPVGNLGLLARPNNEPSPMAFGDPMIMHSNGSKGFAFADPLALVSFGHIGENTRLIVTPSLGGIIDFKDGGKGYSGMAVKGAFDHTFGDKLEASVAAMVASVGRTTGPNDRATYILGLGQLKYHVSPDLEVAASVEASRFDVKHVSGGSSRDTDVVSKVGLLKAF